MTKQDMLNEIQVVKSKLMNTNIGQIERSNLLIALIALYDSVIAFDNNNVIVVDFKKVA